MYERSYDGGVYKGFVKAMYILRMNDRLSLL